MGTYLWGKHIPQNEGIIGQSSNGTMPSECATLKHTQRERLREFEFVQMNKDQLRRKNRHCEAIDFDQTQRERERERPMWLVREYRGAFNSRRKSLNKEKRDKRGRGGEDRGI